MSVSAPVERLYVFGAGGHGREIVWLAGEVLPGAEVEYVVDRDHHPGGPVDGIPVRTIDEVRDDAGSAFVTAVGDSALRRKAVQAMTERGLRAVALIHPRAEIAPSATIDEGAVVCAGSVVSDRVTVGAHVVVNIGCTVSHDVRLAPFATLSPGVHIAGNVTVGEDALLGIGASVTNGTSSAPLTLGAGSVVGAGATVIRDVDPGVVVVGVPARPIRGGGAE